MALKCFLIIIRQVVLTILLPGRWDNREIPIFWGRFDSNFTIVEVDDGPVSLKGIGVRVLMIK